MKSILGILWRHILGLFFFASFYALSPAFIVSYTSFLLCHIKFISSPYQVVTHSSSSLSTELYRSGVICTSFFFSSTVPTSVLRSYSIQFLSSSVSSYSFSKVHSTTSPKEINNCKVKKHISYLKKITNMQMNWYILKSRRTTLYFVTPHLSHYFALFLILWPLA